MNKTSKAVTSTPAHSGILGKIRHSAIAEPNSSARSVLMIAISQKK
jgi:hypothetical protein